MRNRLFTIGVVLLLAALVLTSVTSCQRAAEVRGPQTIGQEALGTATAPSSEQMPTAATVVSAVTIPPATEATPQSGAEGGLPTVALATETVVLPTALVPTVAPAPTSSVPAATSGEYTTYVVEQGDTLAGIAAEYGTTVTAIVQANALTDPNQIVVGQELKIPIGATSTGGTSTGGTGGCRYRHTVTKGEWVWQIARDYDVSPYAILKANGLTIEGASTIYPGMVLCIP